MGRGLLLLLACAAFGCQLPALIVSDPSDLEIAVGPNSEVTTLTNTGGFATYNWGNKFWDFHPLGAGCGGDGFMLYRPSTNELYAATIHTDPTTLALDGWCWGISLDMGISFTWTLLPQLPPFDGARLTYTTDGIWLADGGSTPVHLIRYSFSRGGGIFWHSQAFNVPMSCRRIVRTTDDGAAAFVMGLSPDGSTWELARLFAAGGTDINPMYALGLRVPVPQPGATLNARNGSQTISLLGCKGLSDAWLDRVHQTLWFATTQPCLRDPSHPCVGLYGLKNYAPGSVATSFDDVSTFQPGLAEASSTDIIQTPNEGSLDTWAPRITVDDQGNVLFVAARSGPTRYASMLIGGLNLATNVPTVSDVGPAGQAPFGSRFFDFLGIAPDPGDRRYAWALGEAVQSNTGTSDTADAVAVRFGRQCDPVSHQCAP